jgi:hypothetical protein
MSGGGERDASLGMTTSLSIPDESAFLPMMARLASIGSLRLVSELYGRVGVLLIAAFKKGDLSCQGKCFLR